MARIAGVDLPSEKRIEVALTYIFGIGPSTAKRILSSTGVRPEVRVKNLTDEDTGKLRTIIEREYKVEGALRSEVAMMSLRSIVGSNFSMLRCTASRKAAS